MEKIFIPSKNRVENSTTINLLNEDNLNPIIIVEPQDYEKYHETYPKNEIIILPKDNQGISYVRNFILNYTRMNNIIWYWMLDDDIINFYKVVNKKCVKITPNEALDKAESIIKEGYNVAQGSLEYQQIAWSSKEDFVYNSYCDVCVLINSERSKPITYNPYFNGKEDREFTIKLLLNKNNTIRVKKIAFACPKNGSNNGWLSEIFYYDREKEREVSRKLIERYSKYCSLNIKPDGRPDTKINWGAFPKITKGQKSLF